MDKVANTLLFLARKRDIKYHLANNVLVTGF